MDALCATRPETSFVGVEISPATLTAGARRFAANPRVVSVEHDLKDPIPVNGPLDAVASSFAIHHLEDDRKRTLNDDVLDLLRPGGVFLNLEHVSSPTPRLHAEFLAEIGYRAAEEDVSNRCVDVQTQLGWLTASGFADVDCLWKWREMALLVGWRPEP